MKEWIILELADDGRWVEHDPVEAYNEQLAIETFCDLAERRDGTYLALRADRIKRFQIQQVTSFKAVAAGRPG